MILNYIWIGFILLSFFVALLKLLISGDFSGFTAMSGSLFSSAKTGFEISIGLTGILTLWLGIMKIGENGGVIKIVSFFIGPLFRKIFPEIPKDHPAIGSIMMSFAANMLGLENAATPIGLKAMKEMQDINPDKERASNAQIMFLIMNTAGLTLIPMSVIVYRSQLGAANPSDVFIPIILATFCALFTGLICVAIIQKINLLDKVLFVYFGAFLLLIGGLLQLFANLPKEQIEKISSYSSSFIIIFIVCSFVVLALLKRVNVYESFIEGAKEGFGVAIKIIPYLVAILFAIGLFRASGAMNYFILGVTELFTIIGLSTDFIPALPTAIMKPLSGSGARGMMIDVMKTFGADSFVAKVACTIQGSADTTFYILAVYFGSVGIKNTRYALPLGLVTDLAGIIAAIILAYLFFHG